MADLEIKKQADVIIPGVKPEINNVYKFAPEQNINIFMPKPLDDDYEVASKTKPNTISSGGRYKKQRLSKPLRSSHFVESTFTESRASLVKGQTIGNKQTTKNSDYNLKQSDFKQAKQSIHQNLQSHIDSILGARKIEISDWDNNEDKGRTQTEF